MTTNTDHYLRIDVHKMDAYITVMNEEGELVEEVRVASADLNELAQKYEGSEATLEAGSYHFTICDKLTKHLGRPENINHVTWFVKIAGFSAMSLKSSYSFLRSGSFPRPQVFT